MPFDSSHSTAAIAIGFAAFPIAKIQTRLVVMSAGSLSSEALSAGAGATAFSAAQYSWISRVRAFIGASGAIAQVGWLGDFMRANLPNEFGCASRTRSYRTAVRRSGENGRAQA